MKCKHELLVLKQVITPGNHSWLNDEGVDSGLVARLFYARICQCDLRQVIQLNRGSLSSFLGTM